MENIWIPRYPFVVAGKEATVSENRFRWWLCNGDGLFLQWRPCGEQGGDPLSIKFAEELNLDYVSCSPFRISIARLAAAQAVILKKKNN